METADLVVNGAEFVAPPKSKLDVSNLREEMPEWDTPGLAWQWDQAQETIRMVGEERVPCAMGLETRSMLFKVVRAMQARSVLDIGTYMGTSALAYALAVGTFGNVTTVDLHDANSLDGYWARNGRVVSPRDLLRSVGVGGYVDFVTMDSREFLRHTTRKYDFISIDGWHEDFCVYEEIELGLTRLNPGGMIFLDDVQPVGFVPQDNHDYIDGPRAALDLHFQENAPFDIWVPDDQEVAFLLRKNV